MLTPPSLGTLNSAQNSAQSSLQKISSGTRVGSARDNPANLAVAVSMAAQLGSASQAQRNVADGLSITETADGALGQVAESLQRMRELAVQAGNGSLSAGDRQALQAEFGQLSEQIGKTAASAEFNGQKLLDGSFSAQLQSGPAPTDLRPLNLAGSSPQALAIDNLDIATTSNAANAINAIDGALGKVNDQRAAVGAANAGLNATLANLSHSYENLAASRSRIADTDYAGESASLAQAQVQTQAAGKALNAYREAQSTSVLGLLKA